ncbi:MAG: hypothetical protein GKS00_26600 [Alphaproteobacteria bacterium]|nr:hypothetical protein [Alphaproteobacteria bacterium]
MDAARRLWPRVKSIIERQVERGELELSVSDQRRIIAAVVNDLLEQEKRGRQIWCKPKSINRLLRRLRKQNTELLEQQTA